MATASERRGAGRPGAYCSGAHCSGARCSGAHCSDARDPRARHSGRLSKTAHRQPASRAARRRASTLLLPLLALLAACTGSPTIVTEADRAAGSGSAVSEIEQSEPQASGSPTTASTATTSTTTTSTTTVPTTTPPTTEPLPDPLLADIAQMTVEEKVGQLLMPLVAGTSASQVTEAEATANLRLGGKATPADLIAHYHLGGIIYLGHNIVDAQQTTALSAGLQEQAAVNDLPPLFISIDQEGGRVHRITDGVTPVPSARELSGDEMAIRASSYVSGRELREQGFNVVFAPVADLSGGTAGVIADRSYSADPQVAAAMVTASVRGFRLSGIASTVKHWPGHGATIVDSHQSLPTVDVDLALWTQRERVPFAAAIDEGVDMVMVGHLALPGLDPSGAPASVSSMLVDQLLRDDLGFDGVVVTDALDMGAVSSFERGELAVQSIEAGVDILLAPPDLVAVSSALVEAVESGRLPMERLDESVYRVLRLKRHLRLS